MAFQQIYIKPSLQLFPNQKENVKALVHRRRALLTDHVGSGKTISVLYSYAYLKEKGYISNLLVLTPLSAYKKEVWKQDIQKWTNFTSISVDDLLQKAKSRDELVKLLQHYDIIYGKHTHVKSNLGFLQAIAETPNLLLVIDEIQALRNPKSALTLSAREIALRTRNIWGLSGSTVSKSLEDFYNIINFIKPWHLGSFLAFREEFCTTTEQTIGWANGKRRTITKITGLKNKELFKERIEPIVITGESFLTLNWHKIDYELSNYESMLYKRIAHGINLSPELSPEEWFKKLQESDEEAPPRIKDVDLYSSRFLYLQSATDGILNEAGEQIRDNSNKLQKLYQQLSEIVVKGQSVLVYFDYYATLDIVKNHLQSSRIHARVLESSGRSVLTSKDINEGRVKTVPHIVLMTRAASESVSYYYVNNIIFFHVPTVPSTWVQTVGRITRKNTLYPDDLNVYYLSSSTIDDYKFAICCHKVTQQEAIQGYEANFPDDLKHIMTRGEMVSTLKRTLLWKS